MVGSEVGHLRLDVADQVGSLLVPPVLFLLSLHLQLQLRVLQLALQRAPVDLLKFLVLVFPGNDGALLAFQVV